MQTPTLHPLGCRCDSAHPSFPTDFHHLIPKKRTRTLFLFSPLSSLSPFLLPFTCANQFQPVIILLDQSFQFPFFVSCTFFYSSRLFKFAPSRLPAYLSALPLSRMVSQSRGGKDVRRRGWLRLKGRDHCLEQSCCRMPLIYRLRHPV